VMAALITYRGRLSIYGMCKVMIGMNGPLLFFVCNVICNDTYCRESV
jgi:hypothetical protein